MINYAETMDKPIIEVSASFGSFAILTGFAVSAFRRFGTILEVSPFGIRPNRFRQATLMITGGDK